MSRSWQFPLNLLIGTLKRGDQLLEANGQNLVGVSNERYYYSSYSAMVLGNPPTLKSSPSQASKHLYHCSFVSNIELLRCSSHVLALMKSLLSSPETPNRSWTSDASPIRFSKARMVSKLIIHNTMKFLVVHTMCF